MEEIIGHYKRPLKRCEALDDVHRFNNFVKAALIQTFLKPCGMVLDMPCGRGGDLKKYRENQAGFYAGIDIVPERIEEAKTRHRTTRCLFGALFEVADFTKPLDLESKYDLVSCQFALHYAWDTEERARQVLRNGAERLKAGGCFILTFPDWDRVVERLFESKTVGKTDEGENVYRIGGTRHYLEFTTPKEFHEFMQDLQTEPYGRRYIYYQEGAVERVPEYLIEPRAFESMCKEEGLRLVYDKNFIDFTDAPFGKDLSALRQRMGAPHHPENESRSIIGLYRAVVLQSCHKRARNS